MGHALVRIHRRWGHCGTVMSSSILADFRDAELMLHLRRAYEDIKPYTAPRRYRCVWFSACAFQGIPIVT